MEQRLRVYRNHTAACVHAYRKPIYDGDTDRPDCTCPLNATGYLRHECKPDGSPKRIQHRSVETRDWKEARRTVELWLEWGQTTRPAPGLDRLKRASDVTIQDAVDFFFEFSNQTASRGKNTTKKYRNLLFNRLIPWCKAQGVRFITGFDNPITTKAFFMWWRKQKRIKGTLFDLNEPLAPNTKRAELERYRAFLEFCRGNCWVDHNWALAKPSPGRKGISLPKSEVEPKTAFTMEEYENILNTLENWKDEYGRLNTPKAIMLCAFCLALRYTGQRVSDVSMLGPHSIVQSGKRYFIALTQIKTGNRVKVPVPAMLIEKFRALPFRGELKEPFALKTNNRTIRYGTQFWFWTGRTAAEGRIDTNIQQWLDDVSRVLSVCQQTYGDFQNHATPHTFRHFFAITMLAKAVPVKTVSKWLGHSDAKTTEDHYCNGNSDWDDFAHDHYMGAVEQIESAAAAHPKPSQLKSAKPNYGTGGVATRSAPRGRVEPRSVNFAS